MRRASLAALGVLLAPGAAEAEPFSLTTPTEGGWGRLVLAVVDHDRARPTGESYCFGSQGPDDACFNLPIFQGPAEIVDYLSPRPQGWRHPGRFPQVRFVEGQSVRWSDLGVRLEILEQAAEGDLRLVWSVSAEDDPVCLPQQLVALFRIRTHIRYFSRGGQENCFHLADVD